MPMEINQIVKIAIAVVLIFFGVIFIPKFIPQANSGISSFIDSIPFPFQSKITTPEQFNEYYKEEIEGDLRVCSTTSKRDCYCTNDKLQIPEDYFLRISQQGNSLNLQLLNNANIEITNSSFNQNSPGTCAITNNGKYLLISLEESSLTIKKEDGKNMISFNTGSSNINNEIDNSKLFYKDSSGSICLLDEESSEKLKDKKVC